VELEGPEILIRHLEVGDPGPVSDDFALRVHELPAFGLSCKQIDYLHVLPGRLRGRSRSVHLDPAKNARVGCSQVGAPA
jgi:hypothetical protein